MTRNNMVTGLDIGRKANTQGKYNIKGIPLEAREYAKTHAVSLAID